MQGCRGQALPHSSRGLAVWLHGGLGQGGGTGAVFAAWGQLWGGKVGARGCSYSTPSGNATPTDTIPPTETDTGAPSDTGAPTELVFLLILFPLLIRLLLPKLVLLLVIIAIQFDW